MRVILYLLILAGWECSAHAADSFSKEKISKAQKSCEHFEIPGKKDFFKNAPAWHLGYPARVEAIRRFYSSTCPAYLARPNDGAAIALFVKERAELSEATIAFEQEGQKLQTFLENGHDGMNDFFAESGMLFTDFECGVFFWNDRNHIYEALATLEKETRKIGTKCPLARDFLDKRDAGKNLKSAVKKAESQRAPASVPKPVTKGKSKRGSSDITGVREDEAKRGRVSKP